MMPSVIMNVERLMSNFRSAEISAPIQPPVPGSGKATKAKSPHSLYFTIFLLLFLARSSKKSTTVCSRVRFSTKKILFMKSKINGIGVTLPKTHRGNANFQSIFKILAATKPPRSSKRGINEIKKTANSFEIPEKRPAKEFTSEFINGKSPF